MTILELGRKTMFWLMDYAHGSKIRHNLKLLKQIENGGLDTKEVETYQRETLRRLLRHAANTVPAYSSIGSNPDYDSNIELWPVTNKMTLKEGGERYMSTDYPDKAQLIAMTTSGSTGTPFTCWQDGMKKRHVNAEVLFYNGKIGYEIGRKIIYFRSVVSEVSKSRLQQFMQNINLIDCKDLSDDSISAKLDEIKRLSHGAGAMILSYASTLDSFSRYLKKNGFEKARQCNIYGIVSGSEMLNDETRSILSEAFSCKVVSRYANEENGFLGQDWDKNNVFINNRANYYIEILKFDSDKKADIGEPGRIVVTDLYNYAMPMIRYDTGDVGAWHTMTVDGVERTVIGNFGGRKIDLIYDCEGNIVSGHSLTNNMWRFQAIKQFQLIQKAIGKYTMKLNAAPETNKDEIMSMLKSILGETADITLEYCDEIPVLASGKRRYIVNEMTPKQ